MGVTCDFCGNQRSMIHCRSDAACLCLSCDRNVHSANALSRRHSRTLLCDGCNSQPAIVRCNEEKMSFCQNCDWNSHGRNSSASGHKRQTISCYSGCPSSAELSTMWSFLLEFPSEDKSNCEQAMGLMSIDENNVSNFWNKPEQNDSANQGGSSKDVENKDNWVASSSMSGMGSQQFCEKPAASADSPQQMACSNETKECDDTDIYGNFGMDDTELNFSNYEEFFGSDLHHSEELFDDAGIDDLFEANFSDVNSNGHEDNAVEESSSGQLKPKQVACSTAVSAAPTMPVSDAKNAAILYFPARQARSSLSLSFSGLTGESGANDYQDCGISSVHTLADSTWYSPATSSSLPQATRDSAVMRYKEKKKNRKFDKRIRYESRKARADVRRRVKGRFVKAGEAYDYDPMCQTRSC